MTMTKEEIEQKKYEAKYLHSQIDYLNKELEKLNTEIAEAEKPKEWEPKGGRWFISGDMTVNEAVAFETKHRLSGTERQIKEQAEAAAKQLRFYARMLAYKDEFAPGYEFVPGKNNTYIFFDHSNGEYRTGVNQTEQRIGVIYMSGNAANDLVKKLNSGEVAF